MRDPRNRGVRLPIALAGGLLVAGLALPTPARAGKLSWMDEVVQQVVREAKSEGKVAARAGGGGGGGGRRPRFGARAKGGRGPPARPVRCPGGGGPPRRRAGRGPARG